MQVLFLPSGTAPSRNLQFRLGFIGAAAAGVLLAMSGGAAYLGYTVGQQRTSPSAQAPQAGAAVAAVADFRPVPAGVHPPITDSRAVADAARREAPAPMAAGRDPDPVLDPVEAERLARLRESLEDQRRALDEARQRMNDHVDSLGQRLGRIQAHVSRLNALGQRLTDMAGLDREEFSFDTVPAVGGPERPGPWGRSLREPDLAGSLEVVEIALEEKENELNILEALLTNRELHEKQYPQGWPTSDGGWMSSAYGERTDPFTGRTAFHEGVDIAARSGSEIRAMAAGVVSFAGRKTGYGLMVEINHGNGYETRYAHAKKVLAKVGDRVEKGDAVALVGSTGRSTGSHVHIEVIENDKIVSPHEHLSSSSG